LDYVERLWGRGLKWVAGVDEAGRGPLAGPVVAAAVILHPRRCVPGAEDSKTLTASVREEIFLRIHAEAAAVAVGAASVREIDRVNVLRATSRAMRRALARLLLSPDHVVVDGLPMWDLGWDHEAVVDGDARVHSVACASIVAKVVRDRLMVKLAARYPVYGWLTNAGYGTADHRAALRRHGPSPHHRLTFTGLQLELGL
ncbi:MAG TPA: ribonuclease HII, partial [Longimicrobiales bacterium]